MKRSIIIFFLFLVIAIVVTSRMMLSVADQKMKQDALVPPPATSTKPSLQDDTFVIPEDFVTKDVRGLFEFSYPKDMEYADDGQVARVYKHGPTQKLGTEIYDGLLVSFYTDTYTGDFQDFVQQEHDNKENDSVSEVTSIKQETLSGKTVYTFSETGLGTFDLIYAPLKNNQYVIITSLVADPGQLGFESTAEQIIQSTKISK